MSLWVICALLVVVVGCAIALLLHTLASIRITAAETVVCSDLGYRPMQRVLDPGEFQYLRDCGLSDDRIKKLRRERRRIYRLYLHIVQQDFDATHKAVRVILASAPSDRADLATLVAKQKFTFHRNLLLVKVRLMLDVCELEEMRDVDLVGPVALIQAQLRQSV